MNDLFADAGFVLIGLACLALPVWWLVARRKAEVARLTRELAAARDALRAEAELRRRAELGWRHQRKWFRSVMAGIRAAVLVTDAAGRVTYLNPAAQEMTGWAPEDARGRPQDEVFPVVSEQTRQPVESPAAVSLRDGKAVGPANHTLLIARDGTEWPVATCAAPLLDASDAVTGAVVVFRDAGGQRPGVETILLVEDDAAVREQARQVLQGQGYAVLEAADGREALRQCEGHAGPVHLLLTDVVLPELGGRLLAERLCDLRPGMKVLFLSGYADEAFVRRGPLEAEVHFLQKPFAPAALADKVREALAAAR